MKVFICGAFRTDSELLTKIEWAEKMLRKAGHEPVNPHNAPQGMPYRKYLNRRLLLLMGSDAILIMNDWTQSDRARMEFRYASVAGNPIFTEEAMKEINGEIK